MVRNPTTSSPQDSQAKVAVGYCRRSTDRQEQSIPDQRKAIEQYALEQGLRIARFYVDDAISGSSVAGRKAFQQMIEDAQSNASRFDFVVVYDIKRFGRVDNDEAGYYRHILKSHGVEVRYISENFSGDYTDDLLRPVKQWQARQESKDLSKVTIRGLLSKHASGGGVWMGGVPPHGYDLRYENDRGEFLFILRHMPDGSKQMFNAKGKRLRTLARGESLNISKRDRARLIPGEPARIEVVKKIFTMYTREGRGLSAVADWLNRHNVPTPRGPAWSSIYCGQWADSTVRAILVNPIYMGDMAWNRRTDARFHKISNGQAHERRHPHGARLEPNGRTDWLVVPNAHPPLIPRKMFEQAQRIREGKPGSVMQLGRAKSAGNGNGRIVGGWNGARARFMLSGLIRCAVCGHRYQGCTRTKGKPRKDGTKIRQYYYACGGYIARGTSVCKFRPIAQEKLEQAAIEAVLGFYKRYEGPAGEKLLFETVQKQMGTEAHDVASARKRNDADRRKVESTITNLLDSITPGNRDLVEARLAQLREERQRLQIRAEELERLAQQQQEVRGAVHEVRKFLASLEFTLRHGLPEERKLAIRQCVPELSVTGSISGRVHINALPPVGPIHKLDFKL